MNMVFAIAVGGALGSVARHYATTLAAQAWGQNFPYGTLLVNVTGSFVIGFLMELMAQKWQVSLEMRALLITGFLGGFTTFSAFSFDVLKLVETHQYINALVYAVLSVALSLAAVFAAMHLARGAFA